ncbi:MULTISPECIES: heavy-metal-associated domain-containing protein [Aestuariimicrobium]|uniref:heavy-metal-associated domain-containing protein n=1 Tax=Aestuariimicrobium TaxID=396388 RepID=UPI0003B75FC6|nr:MULTISPECIES: heavy-metal-associated domain-containing protein [Aestuariimicrobium]CAI9404494.1 hypothetical protein AESSP_01219 [Aestuariimicrobium sp. T2.26MG-19.2B]
MITTYTVTGMTCGNCVKHVTEEVSEVEGVTSVNVELDGGSMIVESDQPLDFEAVKAAVSEAGNYAVSAA